MEIPEVQAAMKAEQVSGVQSVHRGYYFNVFSLQTRAPITHAQL